MNDSNDTRDGKDIKGTINKYALRFNSLNKRD
jgi:hypothetical protein